MKCSRCLRNASFDLRRGAWIALVVLSMGWAGGVHAQQPGRDDARATYDQGVQAHGRGDFGAAARLFARADELAPNDTALLAAIEASIRADDAVLAMQLVDRASQRPPNEGVQRAAAQAKAKYEPVTGRLVVRCSGPIRCNVKVDDQEIRAEQSVWVRSGSHTLVVAFGDRNVERNVEVGPGSTIELDIAPPSADPEPAPASAPPVAENDTPEPPAPPVRAEPTKESDSAFSSPWFWIGAGLTTTFAVASIWSANDVSGQHDDFVAAGCGDVGTSGCDDAASDGKSAQLRTNLLLGATALFGAATVAVAVVPSGPQPNQDAGSAQHRPTRWMPAITARGRF